MKKRLARALYKWNDYFGSVSPFYRFLLTWYVKVKERVQVNSNINIIYNIKYIYIAI